MDNTTHSLYFKFTVLSIFILSSACLSTYDNLSSLGINNNSAKYFKLSQNDLYIVDSSKHIIEKLDLNTKNKTLIAGVTAVTGSLDGDALAANFKSPMDIAFKQGVGARQGLVDIIYVADSGNCTIRKIDLTVTPNQVSTVIGTPGTCRYQDTTTDIDINTGLPIAPALRSPRAIELVNDILYIGDNSTIRSYNLSTSTLTTLAGAATVNFLDGVGIDARIRLINDFVLLKGDLYFTDLNSHAIRKFTISNNTVSTLHTFKDDVPSAGFKDQSALIDARFNRPFGLATDGSYRLFVADRMNNSVRIINLTTSSIRAVVGKPSDSFDKNGVLENSSVYRPSAIAYSRLHGIVVGNHFGVHQIK